jgi:hypothetical protein
MPPQSMLELLDTALTPQPNHAAPTFTKLTPGPPSKSPTKKMSKQARGPLSGYEQNSPPQQKSAVFLMTSRPDR